MVKMRVKGRVIGRRCAWCMAKIVHGNKMKGELKSEQQSRHGAVRRFEPAGRAGR
jgi:hypothetical protein